MERNTQSGMAGKCVVMTIALMFGGAMLAPNAMAAKVAGKTCAGMISKQKNPKTGEATRSCRTTDGSIATESAGKGK